MSYTYDYPRPCVSLDCIIFRKTADPLPEVLLIQRKNYPFEGMWAFPGGFLEMDEGLKEGALRELKEETGLESIDVQQLHTFGDPGRDPRCRVITVTFYGFVDYELSTVKGGDDAADARWFPVNKVPQLAFDHRDMLEMALKRIS